MFNNRKFHQSSRVNGTVYRPDSNKRISCSPASHIHSIQRSAGNRATGGVIRRKIALASDNEKDDLGRLFSKADGKHIKVKKNEVNIKEADDTGLDDPFRMGVLKKLAESDETALIKKAGREEEIAGHKIFEEGKEASTKEGLTLKSLGAGIKSRADGITVPSESLALKSDPKYSGAVTGIEGETWVLYSNVTGLSHELGHAYLLFSGASWRHGYDIDNTVDSPQGTPYKGSVDDFIKNYFEEVTAGISLDESEAHGYSPTRRLKIKDPCDGSEFNGSYVDYKEKCPSPMITETDKGISIGCLKKNCP